MGAVQTLHVQYYDSSFSTAYLLASELSTNLYVYFGLNERSFRSESLTKHILCRVLGCQYYYC